MYRYGVTLYIGVGIPIPIINERVAKTAALKDEDIIVNIRDYGIPVRPDKRPVVKRVSYAELRSGKVPINDKSVPSSSLSSYRMAREIADTLKKWATEGTFFLTRPVDLIPRRREFRALKVKKRELTVLDIMKREVVTARPNDGVTAAARKLVEKGIDHLPVVDEESKLIGIVTSWDLAKAIAQEKLLLSEIMTRRVVTARTDESIDLVVWKMAQHNISGVPVTDETNRVIGILTTDDVSRRLAGGR